MAIKKQEQDLLTQEIQEVTEEIKKEKVENDMKKGIAEQIQEAKKEVKETKVETPEIKQIEDTLNTVENNPVILFDKALRRGNLSEAAIYEKQLRTLSVEQQGIAIIHDPTLCRFIPNLDISIQDSLISSDSRYGLLIINMDAKVKAKLMDIAIAELNHKFIQDINTPQFNPYRSTITGSPMHNQYTQRISSSPTFNEYGYAHYGTPTQIMTDKQDPIGLNYIPKLGWICHSEFIKLDVDEETLTITSNINIDVEVMFTNLLEQPVCKVSDTEQVKKYVKQVLDFYNEEPKEMNV